MKKTLPLIVLTIILLVSSFSACQQKTIQASSTEDNPQVRMILFLTLKVVKTNAGLQSELIEQVIREDNNNPLSTGETAQGEIFRCEILNEQGTVLYTSTQKFDFKYQTEEGSPYGFLKFSESLPEGYSKCIVSAQVSEGVWQELYNVKLK